MINGVFEV